jgi:imidazolonepropionase-like amidohydrolase
MMIYNARLITMEHENYENGFVTIENGVIAALGDMAAAPLPGRDDYDAEGGFVIPGFIDGHCHTGLSIWDITETTSPITPEMKIIDSMDTDNPDFTDAARAGITAGAISPGSSNLIGGEVALVKFAGRHIGDMFVRVCGMKGALGANPLEENGRVNKRTPYTRMGSAALLRDAFTKAQRYERAKAEGRLEEADLRNEALLPVLCGELPMHFHAHRSDDIMTAIRIAKEFGIRCVVVHATGGHIVAGQIASSGVPLILGPILFPNCKPEMAEGETLNISRLSDAGVDFCFGTDAQVIRGADLPVSAAIAVSAGMDEMRALRSLTRDTARILGADDRMGSIRPGKDADIAVFNEFPLSYTARARAVFISGRRIL